MVTTTARIASYIARRPLRLSDIFAGLAFAAALGFSAALVFGLIG
jgi:hypothetical protein